MKKVNARMTTCVHCLKERSKAAAFYENGDEFEVCYNCGKVVAKRQFNALDYILDLMRDGITREEQIIEHLADMIADEYYWLEDVDVELLAELMVRDLYDKALFESMAEAMEQAQENRDFREAKAGRY